MQTFGFSLSASPHFLIVIKGDYRGTATGIKKNSNPILKWEKEVREEKPLPPANMEVGS